MRDTVFTEKLLSDLREQLGSYCEKYGKTYEQVKLESKLKTDVLQANKKYDINHIEFFLPNGTQEQVREYSQFISQECRIHGLPLSGGLECWHSSLPSCVAMERLLMFMKTVED